MAQPAELASGLAPFAIRGRLVVDGGLFPGVVVVRDGAIAEIVRDPAGADLPGDVLDAHIVAPGLIDLQVNGAFGVEVGEDADAIRHLSQQLPATGVTAFLPTVVSSTASFYAGVREAFMQARDADGAVPLGLHVEGPFLSARRAGAHRLSAIENAPPDLYERGLLEGEVVRMVTLAPETDGALDRIRRLRERGIVVSLGHTDATYEEFVRGIDHGASLVTHLYSAMSAFRHRSPGAVGAALVDDRVTAGIIADGVHCHPASLRLALKTKGVERIALVTDAIAGAGMAPGTYRLEGQEILVEETGARLADGTLAGSVLTLDQAVRNMVRLGGARVADAIRMASDVPARVLGLSRQGRLAVGFDADLVLLDEGLEVQATFRRGRQQFSRDARGPARAAGA